MTRRASCRVMVSFVFAASAIISLSRRSLSMLALEPLRRHVAQHTLARSQTHGSILLICCGTQPTLVQYLLGRASITMKLDRYSHWIPSMGRAAAEGMDEALG
jgi:integrase